MAVTDFQNGAAPLDSAVAGSVGVLAAGGSNDTS